MTRPRMTLLLVAGAGIAAVGAVVVPLTSPVGLAEGDNPVTLTMFTVAGLFWLAAILVVLARQPRNPLWVLMLAYLVANRFVWALQFVPYPAVQGLAVWIAPMASVLLYLHVLVAYPSGHLRTRFDRVLVTAIYVLVVGVNLLVAATWEPDTSCRSAWCPQNVLLVWPNDELSGRLGQALSLAAPVVGAAVVFAVWRHWWTASPAARRLLLPVAIVVPIAYFVYSVGYVTRALGIEGIGAIQYLGYLADAIVPVGLLLGVLRLRLDRGRVAGLVVELGRGVPTGGLRDALARALGDPTLQLAFAAPGAAAGYIDGAGRPVELPADDPGRALARIDQGGEPLAVLVVDRTIDEEDPGLIEAVSSAALLAIENERLTAQVRAQLDEVRASRVRIVEAADEERRKVERDLHDGAQQRLVTLTMRLEQARAASEGSARLIDETTAELREAIAEVRGLARGLYPPILTEAGLAAAVESLAERASIPVEVRIPEARFPPAVEITAYFVVAEALTNVTRYAEATTARVEAAVADDELVVTVTDDGRGGADPGRGTGLRGLQDRVAAMGGTLDVTSVDGQGTSVRVRLPLGGDAR